LLKAYFDGSWNGKPPGITSVAGYVASLAEWERVETEWQRGLDEWSMDRFHLSGLRNIIGAGEEMAASCIQSFTRIIESSQLCAIGAALLDVDWEEDDWGHDHTVRARLRSQDAGRHLRFGWARRWSMSRIMASLTIVPETSGSSS
jgi:hypothetical protein